MKNHNKFWKNKSILITGNTGFKGTWLSIWLKSLDANVLGYSLEPPTNPSLFYQTRMDRKMKTVKGDIKDKRKLFNTINRYKPEYNKHK